MTYIVCGKKEAGSSPLEKPVSSCFPAGWPVLLRCLWRKKSVHPYELEKVYGPCSEADVNEQWAEAENLLAKL